MNTLRNKISRKKFITIYILFCILPNLIYTPVYLIAPRYSVAVTLGFAGIEGIIWILSCFYFGIPFLYRSDMAISWFLDVKGKKPEPEWLSDLAPEEKESAMTKEQFERRQQFWRAITFSLVIIPLCLMMVVPFFDLDFDWKYSYLGVDVLSDSCFGIAVLLSHTKIV